MAGGLPQGKSKIYHTFSDSTLTVREKRRNKFYEFLLRGGGQPASPRAPCAKHILFLICAITFQVRCIVCALWMGKQTQRGCGQRGVSQLGRQTACLWPVLLLHAVQGLSVVASLVMALKEGTQERGFQCHRFPKELNVPHGNNSQGIRKHILSTINTREGQEISFLYSS